MPDRVASRLAADHRPTLTLKVGDTLTIQPFDGLPAVEGVIVEVDNNWRVYRVTVADDESCCTPETSIAVDADGNVLWDM